MNANETIRIAAERLMGAALLLDLVVLV